MRQKNILMLTVPIFCFFMLRPGPADANAAVPRQITDTTISPGDLKAFEGYYKMEDMYLHITASSNGLVLEQMWDNQKISFSPRTGLDFTNDDGNFPLKFTKAPDGSITQVLAFNRDLWTKTRDYKPLVIKEVQLKASELKALEGKYTMQTDNGDQAFIQIRATDKGVILRQGWDNQEVPFIATSDVDFYCKERSFPLKFTKDKEGNATQVLAFKRDLWKKAKE
ncbi:hypothetical protein ACQ86N_21755 [Puia sp. P3]|uniref:hypothetical protein n=1 Tax=Puia sp. P3 TaxID=3423952 RepID=UPI003D67EC09